MSVRMILPASLEVFLGGDHEVPLCRILQVALKAGLDRVNATRLAIGAKPGKLPSAGLLESFVLPHHNNHVLGAVTIGASLDVEVFDNDATSLCKPVACLVAFHGLLVGIDVVNSVEEGTLISNDFSLALFPGAIPLGKLCGRRCKGSNGGKHYGKRDNSG